jgi:hypothetical protein
MGGDAADGTLGRRDSVIRSELFTIRSEPCLTSIPECFHTGCHPEPTIDSELNVIQIIVTSESATIRPQHLMATQARLPRQLIFIGW